MSTTSNAAEGLSNMGTENEKLDLVPRWSMVTLTRTDLAEWGGWTPYWDEFKRECEEMWMKQ